VGVIGLSDARVVSIHDPNLPFVTSIECMIDSTWQDCSVAQYGGTIEKIRVQAGDPQETPDVRLVLYTRYGPAHIGFGAVADRGNGVRLRGEQRY